VPGIFRVHPDSESVPADSIKRLKNTHLLCCAHPSSLRRTVKYASFLRILRAVHLDVFDPPEKNYFFNKLLWLSRLF
jgi:hypothetical protein